MSCKHNKIIACDTNNSDCGICAVGIAVQSFTEELEKFKAIGLTPEQLQEVDRLYTEKCQEVAELEKKYEAAVNNNGWIPCSEKMPPVETEVLIVAKRKFKGGDFRYIITSAMYEDGTIRENDSCWRWEDIEGKWDEEEDCYIIPEGWWENRHYNPDDVYNNTVDDEVIAWQPLPAPYQPKGE